MDVYTDKYMDSQVCIDCTYRRNNFFFIKHYAILIFVVIEKWPELLRKTYYFSEYLNYYYQQTKESVNKMVTRW